MTGSRIDSVDVLERERQRLLAELLAAEGLVEPVSDRIAPRDPAAPIPLSFAQEVLWLLDRATSGISAYNSPVAFRVRGVLDVDALVRAVGALVMRHEALRTVFRTRGDTAEQVVLAARAPAVSVHDVSDEPRAHRDDTALRILRDAANTPFDLAAEPGFRVVIARASVDEHLVLLLTHHIVSDAWSYDVIFRELSALYAEATGDGSAALLSPALQFGDYAAWQRATLDGPVLDERLAFWRAQLAALPELDVPVDRPPARPPGFGGARHVVTLDASLTDALRALAAREGVTPYVVLLSAFGTLLSRYSSQDDIVIGSAVAGRTRREIEDVVGYFSQALPMRVRLEGEPSFRELLARVSDVVLAAFEHQDVPLEPLMRELRRDASGSHAPLFRAVLTMQDTRGARLRLGATEITPLALDTNATKFDLTLLVAERGSELELTLWYRTDLFAGEAAERMLLHLRTLLAAAIAAPDQAVATLPMLTDEERRQIDERAGSSADRSVPATLAALIQRAADGAAGDPAVVGGGSTLTHGELDARANRLARHLASRGVQRGDIVGVLLDRSADAVVALVAIWKAGAAYVPLDPAFPPARIAALVAECGARVAITRSAFAERLPGTVSALCTDGNADAIAAESGDRLAGSVGPEDLAYVLFTSGSTGVPKGVAVTHGNATHYVRSIARMLAGVEPGASGDALETLRGWSFALVSTLAADLGHTALLPALCGGGTLHVLDEAAATEPARFADYLRAHRVDVLKITPSHLRALVGERRGTDLVAALPARWLVLGGEPLRPDLAERLLDTGSCSVLNHYGPTETTVGACAFVVTPASLADARARGARTVPIGRALPGVSVAVMDRRGEPVPDGVPGELYIAGGGVARGYLNRPELTSERFVTLSRIGRSFRTGDRVRWLSGGDIEFLGRSDDQVKVRGYRVELGEIEQVLRRHPGVSDTAVVIASRAAGSEGADEARMAAYVVARSGGYAASHGDRATPAALSEWLASQLPAYMVPEMIILLDALPLTANGKVDRRALAAMPVNDTAAAGDVGAHVAPRTGTEQTLAQIWAEALRVERVSVTAHFLALGGHSLIAIRILGKLSRAFGVRLPLRALFEAPTVEQLAREVDAARGASPVPIGA